jgi:outer membrane biogenesis lipoprotein LolB
MTRFLLPFCALLLAACSTLPTNTAGPRPAAYREQIELEGAISVRYSDQREQPQLLSGTYRWVQQGERTDVTLLSPCTTARRRPSSTCSCT